MKKRNPFNDPNVCQYHVRGLECRGCAACGTVGVTQIHYTSPAYGPEILTVDIPYTSMPDVDWCARVRAREGHGSVIEWRGEQHESDFWLAYYRATRRAVA